MSEYPSLWVGVWWARPWNTNPLMRGSDRFEALVRMLAAVAILVAVPVAAAAGTADYVAAAARISSDNAAKIVVAGTITGDPKPVVVVAARGEVTGDHAEAPVRWNQDGRSGTATVDVPAGTSRGDEVPVWLAPDGSTTSPPKRSDAAAGQGVGAALTVLIEMWGATLALVVVLAWALDVRRRARWAREWQQIGQQFGRDRQR
ncbi:hypothetical protein AB0E01_40510 [Nocardia vinacea]|uniref:Rv1733c family protein n=1 Tax=Nocardia vinacea TaxID=96468 RepID=UPI0033E28222